MSTEAIARRSEERRKRWAREARVDMLDLIIRSKCPGAQRAAATMRLCHTTGVTDDRAVMAAIHAFLLPASIPGTNLEELDAPHRVGLLQASGYLSALAARTGTGQVAAESFAAAVRALDTIVVDVRGR